MAKRFVSPDWKVLRKLSPSLRQAYFYCWDKADACGVYEHDPLYMKADLGFALSVAELKKLPGVNILSGERIFFTDFILTNYGTLKEGYNPHKPVFRALEKNKISSLLEACAKLEDEDEGKEEDEDEGKEEEAKDKRKKVELVFPYNSAEFMQLWSVMAEGPKWKKKNQSALQASLKILSRYPERVAIDMMEKCIAGNWQGLVEPKNNYNATNFGTNGTGGQKLGTSAARIEALKRW
jgi:hypothetical protein